MPGPMAVRTCALCMTWGQWTLLLLAWLFIPMPASCSANPIRIYVKSSISCTENSVTSSASSSSPPTLGNGCAESTGTDRRVCNSIQHAIDNVKVMRGSSSRVSTTAEIILLPMIKSQCKICLTSERTGVLIGSRLNNFEIFSDGQHDGCNYSTIETADPTMTSAYFKLERAVQVVFRGLQFAVPENVTVFDVEYSSQVIVDTCRFNLSGEWRKAVTLNVLNSEYVFFVDCILIRSSCQLHLTQAGKLGFIHPVLKVVDNASDSEIPSFKDSSSCQTWLLNHTSPGVKKARDEAGRFERSVQLQRDCSVRFVVAVTGCNFDNIGVRSPRYSQLEFSIHTLKGSGVHIDTYPSNHASFVYIGESSFSRLSGPEGSAVFIRVRNSSHQQPAAVDDAPRHVCISECRFHSSIGLLGGAVSARFDSTSAHASIAIADCEFRNNTATLAGGGIFMRFARRAHSQNCLSVSNSIFTDNRGGSLGRFTGSAIHLFSDGRPESGSVKSCYPLGGTNPVNIYSGVFTANSGFGSVFSRSTNVGFYNFTHILNNTGTGLVSMNSKLTFYKGIVRISYNTGINGGGIHVGEYGMVDFALVTHLEIKDNTASYSGGALYIDSYSSTAAHDKLHTYVGEDRYLASCPVLLPEAENATNYDHLAYSNSGDGSSSTSLEKDAIPAFYSKSWHKCYLSYKIVQLRLQSDRQRQLANRTYCWPYPPAQWSSVKVQTLLVNCSANHSDFLNIVKGDSDGNGFLEQPIACHSACQNFTVIGELNLFRKLIHTSAAWMFFKNASTACYKKAGDKVWFFRTNCSRENIFRHAMNENTRLQRFDCNIFKLAQVHERFRSSLMAILPGYPLLLTPWSSLIHMWNEYNPEEFQEDAEDSGRNYTQLYNETCTVTEGVRIDSENAMGDLTLYPAPGEQFDLSLNVVDEFLSTIRATLSIQVETTDENVILRQNNRNYGIHEKLYYSSRGDLNGLELAGVPGSSGHLVIALIGRSAIRHANAPTRDFDIRIPFMLRNCFPGFKEPAIKNSALAAKHISQNVRYHGPQAFVSDYHDLQLVCRCPLDKKGVHRCSSGRDILVKNGYWAGNFSDHQLSSTCVFNKAAFLSGVSSLPGDTCNARRSSKFAIGHCDNGLCNSKNSTTPWTVSAYDPCIAEYKRTGPMCGSCVPGTSVLISAVACYDCADHTAISIYVYLLLVFLCSALLFTSVLILNIGVSSILNSWIFFIQAIFMIFADNVTMRTVFYSVMTFGLGHVCTREQLTPLQARAAIAAQPLFISLFSFLIWFAVRKGVCAKYLQHLQRRHSLAHVIWLSVIYCNATLAYIATSLLNAMPLDTSSGMRYVLFIDGSVELFSRQHAWYGVVAILVLLIFVVPAPIVMAVPSLRSLPQFKWYTDEAMTLYEPECHWWAAVDLSRRLVLACMQGFISNGRIRRYAVAITCVVLLATQAAYRPLKRRKTWKINDIDNKIETLLLFDLCILAVAKISVSCIGWPSIIAADVMDNMQMALYITPTVICLVVAAYRFAKSFQEAFGRNQPTRRYSVDDGDEARENALGMTALQSRNAAGNSTSSMPSAASSSRSLPGASASSLSGADCSAAECPAGTPARPKWLVDFDLPVANGLRDPLLIEHLLREDEYPED